MRDGSFRRLKARTGDHGQSRISGEPGIVPRALAKPEDRASARFHAAGVQAQAAKPGAPPFVPGRHPVSIFRA